MTRLLLLTPAAFSADPRARRAADAAAELGWDVTVIDADRSLAPSGSALITTHHVHPGRATIALRRVRIGGFPPKQRAFKRELRGLFRLFRFTLLNLRFIRVGRRVGQFEVVHGNDLETLPAAVWLARRSGARLIYDAHEIYSAQEPNPPKLQLAISSALERLLARRADSVVTVSAPIAAELKDRLGLEQLPSIVLNCPSLTDAPRETPVGSPLRVIYQGAMGPGRSTDDIFAAAAVTNNVHFSIRLVGTDLSALRQEVARLGLQDRVEILEPVDSSGLVSALTDFDVGIIINRPVTRNDELVLPNKLFEYMMAGLAVVTPHLPSLAALIEDEQVGVTFEPSDPSALADVLTALATRPEEVMAMRRQARRAAVTRYQAEAQRPALYSCWGL